MENHYSKPQGFVGRNICYAIGYGGKLYGTIVGGSATLHLPNRNEFFGEKYNINSIINNIFYHIEPDEDTLKYPLRNFTIKVLETWRNKIVKDWEKKYSIKPIGFESLVELPRSGEIYKRDGWIEVGITKGFTCKRISGQSTDSWSGKRVWNTTVLKPKKVFCRFI
jgi:hypothetical protein